MRANFVIITPLLSLFAIFGLFGCDNAVNTDTICKNNPELCDDLHRDSWCRYEKSDLIQKRYALKNSPSPSGKQIYQHLINLEKYSKCIELAAGVQHILHPERTNDRVRAFGISAQNLAELRDSTKNSKDLYLSFYHWVRFGDQQAQARVIKMERAGEVKDPLILAHLAAYYQKSDLNKAKSLYLTLLDIASREEFDPNWLLGLASIYHQENNLEKTYLFSKANVLMTSNTASAQKMSALVKDDPKLEAFLTEQAETLVNHLNDGDYASSEIRQQLNASN
ncbi:DUF2989 domain-containing protein [Shewanella psychrotolerans]|uniref:DUF2989 domain-containing protein n=1 Tax=Shewanella psychrotolerans TaxID=2864206 RepID=UPI001C6558FD|nr:DUF2989 domain-containing protein [Shewanella psychrotolerans]QYK03082.1 DUF2989 domain-containing protein [Shewanella psychrotolerans]